MIRNKAMVVLLALNGLLVSACLLPMVLWVYHDHQYVDEELGRIHEEAGKMEPFKVGAADPQFENQSKAASDQIGRQLIDIRCLGNFIEARVWVSSFKQGELRDLRRLEIDLEASAEAIARLKAQNQAVAQQRDLNQALGQLKLFNQGAFPLGDLRPAFQPGDLKQAIQLNMPKPLMLK